MRTEPRFWKRGLLAAGLLLKLLILAVFGPFFAPDSGGYVALADAMLADAGTFTRVPDWDSAALPQFAFRPFGYPLLIAGAKLLAGSGYDDLLIVLQIALSIAVAALLFDVVLGVSDSLRLAAMSLVLYFLSETILWDNEILSDSLYASLFNLVILTMLRALLRRQKLSAISLIGLGLVWSYSILVRDTGLYFVLAPVAVLLCMFPWRMGLPRVGIFLAPVIIFIAAYAGWNTMRTGETFLSMTSTANYLQPVFAIKRASSIDPFAGDSALDRLARAAPPNYGYLGQPELLQQLHDELGLKSPIPLQRVVSQKFIDTVTEYPLAYAAFVARNLDPRSFGAVLYNPLFTYNEFFQIGVPPYERVVPGSGIKSLKMLAQGGNYGGVAIAVLSGIASAVSGLLWITVTAGLCILMFKAVRQGVVSRPLLAALLMLGIFWFVAAIYALVHAEARYSLPVIACGLGASAYAAATFIRVRERKTIQGLALT